MHWKNMGDGIREKQHKIHKRYGHEASGGSQAWSVEECFAFDHAAARTPEEFLNLDWYGMERKEEWERTDIRWTSIMYY